MKIVHDIYPQKQNWYINCPICGAEFQETDNIKMLTHQRNLIQGQKCIEDKTDKVVDDYYDNDTEHITICCSKCTFQVEYIIHYESMRKIQEVNNGINEKWTFIQ